MNLKSVTEESVSSPAGCAHIDVWIRTRPIDSSSFDVLRSRNYIYPFLGALELGGHYYFSCFIIDLGIKRYMFRDFFKNIIDLTTY